MPTLHFNGDDEQELTPYSKRLAAQSGTIIYSTEQGGKGMIFLNRLTLCRLLILKKISPLIKKELAIIFFASTGI